MKEIETCDHLLLYCNKLKAKHGLAEPTSEEVAQKTQKEMINDYNKQDLEQKLKDGKILAVHSKKEETMTIIGGGGKKKGKKQKTQQKADTSKQFNIDFVVINKFGLVSVSPPISPEDLGHKIEELTNKKKKFFEDGENQMKQDKDELMNYIEYEVEQEIEAEKKAAEEEEYGYEDEEVKEETNQRDRQSHRGRGGASRGFGDRQNEEDGGYFSKYNKKGKQTKGEFEGSSDEEEYSYNTAAYSKPQRGGGKQVGGGGGGSKKVALALDEDNFPTL